MEYNQPSEIVKDVNFGNDANKKVVAGVEKLAKAVKSTLGASGKCVIYEDARGKPVITKDGVTVAESVVLYDPVENIGATLIKEAARNTVREAGDGTTTAIVLTEALVRSGLNHMSGEVNSTEVIRIIRNKVDEVIKELGKRARKVTGKRLLDVATISANNDKELGKLITDTYNEVGLDGIVTVERSQTAETYAEITTGIKVDRGYTSPLFINNHKKDECVMEDVKILVCDAEINNIMQIENVLKEVVRNNDKLLIIGTCSTNMINTLAANVMKNGLKFCNIEPPNFCLLYTSPSPRDQRGSRMPACG